MAGCSTQAEKIAESSDPVTATADNEPETPAPATVTPHPPQEPTLLRIATVGDIMIGTDYPENHLPDDDGVSFLAAVTPFLQAADITIGNLEGVLMDDGEPRKQCKNPQACYLFRTPARYATYFVEAGFDVMSLANNHSRDFGEEGRTASMRNLANAGIKHTGREGDFAFMEASGLSVAVLGYAVTVNSNLLLDYDIAAATVQRLAATHDIVVITFHGGAEGTDVTRLPFAEEEYFGEMRGDVVKFARLMVDSGADLVVGHGPHVVRGMERYKDRLIAYSLGNFATYYGISVEGIKGLAPVLVTTLDEEGRFVEGQIYSTQQTRPAGPTPDPDQQVLELIRNLSIQDFTTPGITFLEDGRLLPEARNERMRYVEGTLE
jgi:poly-gamma-glutamate capsule biosynthesis protein CapA/YwtB (metallophosphatase superfamily)